MGGVSDILTAEFIKYAVGFVVVLILIGMLISWLFSGGIGSLGGSIIGGTFGAADSVIKGVGSTGKQLVGGISKGIKSEDTKKNVNKIGKSVSSLKKVF